MKGAYLGPAFTDARDRGLPRGRSVRPIGSSSAESCCRPSPRYLAEEKIVGWFNGRMEFGPRALGARSILGDPRSPRMQAQMNIKIKFREGFRPFAPSVLRETGERVFRAGLRVAVHAARRAGQEGAPDPDGRGSGPASGASTSSTCVRSDIPAVTHIDYSARVQTVSRETNPDYYDLIHAFEQLTGCAVLVNTSFNVRGEPIVCTPADAYRCFMRTHHRLPGARALTCWRRRRNPSGRRAAIGNRSSSSTDARPRAASSACSSAPRSWSSRRCCSGAAPT